MKKRARLNAAIFASFALAWAAVSPISPAVADSGITSDAAEETIIMVDPADGIPLTAEEISAFELEETVPLPEAGSLLKLSPDNGFQTFINTVKCGNRTDWYRIKNESGSVWCFANKGTATLDNFITRVTTLCPGSNSGQVRYWYGNAWHRSKLRGPFANGKTCFKFDDPVSVKAVYIY